MNTDNSGQPEKKTVVWPRQSISEKAVEVHGAAVRLVATRTALEKAGVSNGEDESISAAIRYLEDYHEILSGLSEEPSDLVNLWLKIHLPVFV
ncbi:MAG: hypothetical protein Q8R88_10530 [Desulfoprunum sp.]|nr:hypothetical protein [Desulfoprunum sp.]